MTKIVLPSLLTMAFSVAAFSETILRTADISLNNSNYSIEVQIEKTQLGAGIKSQISLLSYGDPEIPGHGHYACEEKLTIQGDVKMTYTLRNSAGKVIGRQTAAPELAAREQQAAEADTACKPFFPIRVEALFSKADEFVNFKTADGLLSISANFSAYVISDESYTAYVEASSLQGVRYFLNNTNGKNASLIDPANPPVETDPYCEAHPYDCD